MPWERFSKVNISKGRSGLTVSSREIRLGALTRKHISGLVGVPLECMLDTDASILRMEKCDTGLFRWVDYKTQKTGGTKLIPGQALVRWIRERLKEDDHKRPLRFREATITDNYCEFHREEVEK